MSIVANQYPATRLEAPRTMNTRHRFAAMLLGCIAFLSLPAQAEIRRIAVDKQETLAAEENSNIPAYEKLRGRLFGEVDPLDPHNAIIQDIALAPRNERGKVEYISTFTLFRPIKTEQNNRVLLVEVPNRGGRGTAIALDFLFSRGYSMLLVGWQGDLREKPDATSSSASLQLESLNAPRAGAAGDKSITGPYLIRVPTVSGIGPSGTLMKLDQGRAGPLSYFPASYDTRAATFTGGPAEDRNGRPTGPRYRIPSSDWTWWNCSANAPATTAATPADLCVQRLKGNFEPAQSYTLTFNVRDPLVLGLGLAALRDASSFFRYAAAGTHNPLAGRIDHVISQGASQVGGLVRTAIALGFNADEQDRQVWDGANVHVSGRRTPINHRFATPGSSTTLFMPGSEGVLWWGKARNSLRGGPEVSVLDRCSQNNTCPKIFETFGGAELWNQRMTPGLVTLDLQRDIPLPRNVRRYFFPGTSHQEPRGGFQLHSALGADRGDCLLATNPNPKGEQMRALLVALTDWVVKDAAPPPSRYPTLTRHELVRDAPGALRALRWSGIPQPFEIANPLLVYDYGKDFDYVDMSGVITRMPPSIVKVVPALVPQVDADGNELGGIRSVQMRAPLGTFLSWNLYRDGPYKNRLCSFNGSFIPFAKTQIEQQAAGDPRASIEERYVTRRGYVTAVERAVGQAMEEGFLLPDDASRLIREATEATLDGDLNFLPN